MLITRLWGLLFCLFGFGFLLCVRGSAVGSILVPVSIPNPIHHNNS